MARAGMNLEGSLGDRTEPQMEREREREGVVFLPAQKDPMLLLYVPLVSIGQICILSSSI